MSFSEPLSARIGHARWILRIVLAVIFISHGATRIYMERVTAFGEALDGWGFPFGLALAWGVTVFEIIGSLLLILDRQVRAVCVLFIVQMMTGIIFVHWPHGWFVVGHGTYGMEYSVLLIAALLALAVLSRSRR